MLDLIRKKQRSVLVKLVFWTIIAAFVGTIFLVWGKGSEQGGRGNVLFHVNGDAVGYQEYQSTYENLRQSMEQRFGRSLPPEIEKQLHLHAQAYDLLIDRLLLMQEADRRDLAVDKDALRQAIAEIPAFQRDGQFDRKAYERALAGQRLAPRDFERNMRQQLLLGKVLAAVRQEASVSDADVDQAYRDSNEKVDLSFVKLSPGSFESKVAVSDADLQAYYKEHSDAFRQPEKVSLRYLRFDPESYVAEINPDETALRTYYEKHKDRFWVAEQVKASHILFRITADLDEDGLQKKRALAEKVLAKVRAGEDFGKLARTYSDDAASAVKGGDLGYFTRGTRASDFENVAFSLQPGQVADLVQSSTGFHIVKCEGYIEGHTKPLDDVREQVRTELRRDLARQAALDKAMQAYSAHRQDGDIDAMARDNQLEVLETGLFGPGAPIDGLGRDAELNAVAFGLKEGALARPLVREQGVYTFVVKQRQASYVPELDEVRGVVEQAYRRQESVALARQAADQLLADLKAGKKLAAVARAKQLKVEATGLFPRSYGNFIPRIGTSEALAEQAFELTAEAPVADQVFVIDDRFVVASLQHRVDADPASLTDVARKELRASVLANKQEQQVRDLLERLKNEADIKIEPAMANILEGDTEL